VKTRRGLVSNSSNSSFLLFLKKKPRTKKEVKKLLFLNQKRFKNPYYSKRIEDSSKSWSTDEIAGIILKNMNKGGVITKKTARKVLSGRDSSEWIICPKDLVYDIEEGLLDSEYIIHLNYSDKDGEIQCALKHGDAFKRVPHIKISEH
jgi:hypothetical protein